eukprot:TRINITY_DN3972_c0_g1_i6.p1 TRINITY_DN3972_c0_g1~~TRINITY_DN3972_c0_g1_i6.p1  ORF type:complete len:488 (+),score=70.62 TRINITY_DN3972_c0_g1_i6:811-2274(+)
MVLTEGERRVLIFSFCTDLETTNPTTTAIASLLVARTITPEQLFQSHADLWKNLSDPGVHVTGNLELSQAINSSNYYILSSVRDDWHWSLSPGGLASNGYNGHTFWDCETWMFPSILPFHPEIAEGILEYRFNTLDGARLKAKSYNPPYQGAMYAWESAFSGIETCPSGGGTCLREIHIGGDIAFAFAQYATLTQQLDWISEKGFPVVSEIANFWLSRASTDLKSINNVIPPDEYHDHVDNSVYTNYVAKFTLETATTWALLLNQQPSLKWLEMSRNLTFPFDSSRDLYLEYDGYNGNTIKQADTILLVFPLGLPGMTRDQMKVALDYYTPKTDINGPAMTWAMTSVGYLQINQPEEAAKYFEPSYANIHSPFNVWYETPGGGTVNFITGAGGFLQLMIYGYSGLRINSETGNLDVLNFPHLPPGTESFSLKEFKFLGNSLRLYFTQSVVEIFSDQKGMPLTVSGQKLTSDGVRVQRNGVSFWIGKA